MSDLFAEDPNHRGGARRAPADLNPAEWRALRTWAEQQVPWVSRGALGSLRTLEAYADECLAHFRSTMRRRPGWLATVENWIRRDERKRVERMAAQGNDAARLACRDPRAWAAQYDRKARATAETPSVPVELIAPRDGAGLQVDTLSTSPRP